MLLSSKDVQLTLMTEMLVRNAYTVRSSALWSSSYLWLPVAGTVL